MKKKLGLLATLAMCVTVGGVYATWIYAEGPVDASHPEVGITLAGYENETDKGTLYIDKSNWKLLIDDLGNKDFKAELNETGTIKIKFRANAGSDISSFTAACVLSYAGDDLANWTYTYPTNGGQTLQIFTNVNSTAQEVVLNDDDHDGVWEGDLKIADMLTLNNNIYLETYAEYEAFNAALGSNQFKLTLSDANE